MGNGIATYYGRLGLVGDFKGSFLRTDRGTASAVMLATATDEVAWLKVWMQTHGVGLDSDHFVKVRALLRKRTQPAHRFSVEEALDVVRRRYHDDVG